MLASEERERTAEGRERERGTDSIEPPHAFTTHAFSSLGAYWLGILLWTRVVAPVTGAGTGCPTGAASAAKLVAEVVAGLVAYDFVFFWLHMGMHLLPRVGRAVGHSQHHDFDGKRGGGGAASESAFRTVNHSLVDGSLQVLTNILVQRHTPWGSPKLTLARWLHNVVATCMLVEAHTTAPRPRVFRRLFVGVRDHHLHHRHRGAPYQQFFGHLDSALLWSGAACALRGRNAPADKQQ